MKWSSWLGAVGAVLVAVAVVPLAGDSGKRADRSAAPSARQPHVESGYVASDPALLATTGRPQLVEFFHHA